jgi:hypothetical protein
MSPIAVRLKDVLLHASVGGVVPGSSAADVEGKFGRRQLHTHKTSHYGAVDVTFTGDGRAVMVVVYFRHPSEASSQVPPGVSVEGWWPDGSCPLDDFERRLTDSGITFQRDDERESLGQVALQTHPRVTIYFRQGLLHSIVCHDPQVQREYAERRQEPKRRD